MKKRVGLVPTVFVAADERDIDSTETEASASGDTNLTKDDLQYDTKRHHTNLTENIILPDKELESNSDLPEESDVTPYAITHTGTWGTVTWSLMKVRESLLLRVKEH